GRACPSQGSRARRGRRESGSDRPGSLWHPDGGGHGRLLPESRGAQGGWLHGSRSLAARPACGLHGGRPAGVGHQARADLSPDAEGVNRKQSLLQCLAEERKQGPCGRVVGQAPLRAGAVLGGLLGAEAPKTVVSEGLTVVVGADTIGVPWRSSPAGALKSKV